MKKPILLLFFVLSSFFQISAQGNLQYKTQENILYRAEANADNYMKERCRLDIYYPANQKGFPTIVWFHGGGITGGEKFIPEELKNKGVAIIAVNYRLSPKVKNPAYIEDAAAAVAWTFKNIEKYGGSVNKIIVSGHSAGGYLASMIGLDARYLKVYGIDTKQIATLVPFSGHTITHFTIRSERGIPGTQPIIDEFAPIYFVGADTPPLHLITGDREQETLGRYEENAYMYRMMKEAGSKNTYLYELDGFNHGEMAVPAFGLLLKIVKAQGLLENK